MIHVLILPSALCMGIVCAALLFSVLRKITLLQAPSFKECSSAINNSIMEIRDHLREHPDSLYANKVLLYAAGAAGLLGLIVTGRIIFALLCTGISFAVSRSYIRGIKKKRNDTLNHHLIDMLAAVTTAVRSGQSLLQALEMASHDTKPSLKKHLSDALHNVRLGTPINEALYQMAASTGSKDMQIVATAITLAKESGGNLGEILVRIAETMREREKLKGKIKALTAQGRASGIIMSITPFLLLGLLYAMEPGMVGLFFTTILGNILLALAVIMIGIGSYIIKRLIYIDI